MAVTEVDFDVRRLLDLLEESEPGAKAEFVAGGFFLNRPIPLHQLIVARILRGLELPEGFVAMPDLRILSEVDELVPDVAVVPESLVTAERSFFRLGVDEILLVVEVLSPSTRKLDETTKLDTYAKLGVEYWTIDPADLEAGFTASGRSGDIPFPDVTS